MAEAQHKQDRLELKIEALAYGADAVAHDTDGKTIFVRGGVPGDRVEAETIEDKGSFLRAVVTHVVEPSSARVVPECPYANLCGGCPWAHISRPEQLLAKRSATVDSLTRIAHLEAERAENLVGDILSPGDPWGYRNKVELAMMRQDTGRFSLGMHAADGHSLVRVDQCLLLDRSHERLVKSATGALAFLASRSGVEVERVALRASSRTKQIEVALWTQPSSFPRAQAAKVLTDSCKASSIVRVITKGPKKARRVSRVERLSGAGSWEERVSGECMRFSAPSFFQVNTAGAEALISVVLELGRPGADEVCWDLYSGAGTFTLPLARASAYVCAIEAAGSSVRDLRRNLEIAHLDNVEVEGGDAAFELPEETPDLVVVDPPRSGLDPRVVASLSKCRASRIVYVSCDPATLARDIARFEEHGTYHLERVVPVDQFAQTFHIENVALLTS